jgi:hypothetical protein
MHPRRLASVLLVALLVYAGLHCAAGDHVTFDAQGVPHKHCHDESGCICKGATFAEPVTVAAPDDCVALLPLLDQATADTLHSDSLRVALNHLAAPPPLSGKALRAYLGSLVI